MARLSWPRWLGRIRHTSFIHNCCESQGSIFQSTQRKPLQLPSLYPGISRVNSVSTLGIVINNRLTAAADHVSSTLVIVVLEYDVRTPHVARSRYATQNPARYMTYIVLSQPRFSTATDCSRIDAFLGKSKRLGH